MSLRSLQLQLGPFGPLGPNFLFVILTLNLKRLLQLTRSDRELFLVRQP